MLLLLPLSPLPARLIVVGWFPAGIAVVPLLLPLPLPVPLPLLLMLPSVLLVLCDAVTGLARALLVYGSIAAMASCLARLGRPMPPTQFAPPRLPIWVLRRVG